MSSDVRIKMLHVITKENGVYISPTEGIDKKEELLTNLLIKVTGDRGKSKKVARDLRDLELLSKKVADKAGVDMRALESLTAFLGTMYGKGGRIGLDILPTLFKGNQLLFVLNKVSKYIDAVQPIVHTNERSILIDKNITLEQSATLVSMLVTTQQELEKVLSHLVAITVEYEISNKRINSYEESIAYKWFSYNKDLYAKTEGKKIAERDRQHHEKMQRLKEEEARILKQMAENKKARERQSGGIQSYNGRNYDMDAINAGYHELATHTDDKPSWFERKFLGRK